MRLTAFKCRLPVGVHVTAELVNITQLAREGGHDVDPTKPDEFWQWVLLHVPAGSEKETAEALRLLASRLDGQS